MMKQSKLSSANLRTIDKQSVSHSLTLPRHRLDHGQVKTARLLTFFQPITIVLADATAALDRKLGDLRRFGESTKAHADGTSAHPDYWNAGAEDKQQEQKRMLTLPETCKNTDFLSVHKVMLHMISNGLYTLQDFQTFKNLETTHLMITKDRSHKISL